jgi:hypothetical protein
MGFNPLFLFWRVTFADGSVLEQFKPDGQEISFKEVLPRISDISKFELLPFPTEERALTLISRGHDVLHLGPRMLPTFSLHLAEDQRLIFFRRNDLTFVRTSCEITSHTHIYMIGFQETIAGENRKFCIFYDPRTNAASIKSMKNNSKIWSDGTRD